jgi:retron-type reverse transcriptase
LLAGTYRPGGYRTFEIFEPKRRLISAAPIRDRVVHHALCGVLEPVFEPTFVFDSYACRRGKGTHAALNRFRDFARRHRYVLQCDVRKFFPSVDHQILKELLARKIKDRAVLSLVDRIIDGSNTQETAAFWFPSDDLFTPSERRRGLPIGNQTSQFFANVYLNPFDHFVHEQLKAGCYVRYVDDFAVFSNDKRWLAEARTLCAEFLAGLRLKLHPRKSVIARTQDGNRFLGFRQFPHYRLVARDNIQRMRRRLRRMSDAFQAGELSFAQVRDRIVSWIGHVRHADSHRLRERLLGEFSFARRSPQ